MERTSSGEGGNGLSPVKVSEKMGVGKAKTGCRTTSKLIWLGRGVKSADHTESWKPLGNGKLLESSEQSQALT